MIRRKLMPDKYLLIIYIALLIAGLLAIYGAQTLSLAKRTVFSKSFAFAYIYVSYDDFYSYIARLF